MVKSDLSDWCGEMVPRPNPLAAVGDALRQAFPADGAAAALHRFAEPLARLATARGVNASLKPGRHNDWR